MENKGSKGDSSPKFNKDIQLFKAIVLLIILVVVIGAGFTLTMKLFDVAPFDGVTLFPRTSPTPSPGGELAEGFRQFESEADFSEYLAHTSDASGGVFGPVFREAPITETFEGVPDALESAQGIGGGGEAPQRVSETNVQVEGIDEPDILKTDGNELYYSPQNVYYARPVPLDVQAESSIREPFPPETLRGAVAVRAFPVSDLKLDAEFENRGEMLLADDTLVMFDMFQRHIYGYDVSDPSNPEEEWTIDLQQSNLVTARLKDGKIYAVMSRFINRNRPCPVDPLVIAGTERLIVPCTDIYYPITPSYTDTTYTVMVIDPSDGSIRDTVSFVGSIGNSVIYVSHNALYATFYERLSPVPVVYDFFNTSGSDLMDKATVERLGRLAEYDISNSAKMVELQVIIQEYFNGLDDDERLRVENELQNRFSEYVKTRARELEQTEIIKIALDSLDIKETGAVPGRLLNQFSVDEYEGNVRLATTVEGSFWGVGFRSNTESVNDVYVLNGDLDIIGSVLGLGVDERIFSARFVGDRGYVVTFRQIDPFFVLDLSDSRNPRMTGELKIPGFSSYLHPVSDTLILGVGREGSQVKLSLFDVSDPTDPREVSNYQLAEGWTQVQNTHHAFLLDDKFRVFFMPGGRGGYIFSYENDELRLVRAVSNIQAQRALFIDDFLYIVGDEGIVVYNETDWSEVRRLSF